MHEGVYGVVAAGESFLFAIKLRTPTPRSETGVYFSGVLDSELGSRKEGQGPATQPEYSAGYTRACAARSCERRSSLACPEIEPLTAGSVTAVGGGGGSGQCLRCVYPRWST